MEKAPAPPQQVTVGPFRTLPALLGSHPADNDILMAPSARGQTYSAALEKSSTVKGWTTGPEVIQRRLLQAMHIRDHTCASRSAGVQGKSYWTEGRNREFPEPSVRINSPPDPIGFSSTLCPSSTG
jgi:hypothetical protein